MTETQNTISAINSIPLRGNCFGITPGIRHFWSSPIAMTSAPNESVKLLGLARTSRTARSKICVSTRTRETECHFWNAFGVPVITYGISNNPVGLGAQVKTISWNRHLDNLNIGNLCRGNTPELTSISRNGNKDPRLDRMFISATTQVNQGRNAAKHKIPPNNRLPC